MEPSSKLPDPLSGDRSRWFCNDHRVTRYTIAKYLCLPYRPLSLEIVLLDLPKRFCAVLLCSVRRNPLGVNPELKSYVVVSKSAEDKLNKIKSIPLGNTKTGS